MANLRNRQPKVDPQLPKRRFRVTTPRDFSDVNESVRFVSQLNKELGAITEEFEKLPPLDRSFDPADYVKRVDIEDLLTELDEIDAARVTAEGEDDIGRRRGRRASRRRRAIQAAVEAAIQNAIPTIAPPEVEDAGSVGSTDFDPGPTLFALSDHTHSGVNLSDVQDILALKHFSGGIDGGPASTNDLIVNSNPSKDGRIILGDDITGTDSVVIHGTETGITIGGAAVTSRLAIHGESAADSNIIIHKHNNTGAAAPTFLGARTRGTEASETAVADNDVLLRLLALGFDGTDFERAAQIHAEVDDTSVSGTSMGGALVLSTTKRGAVALSERLRVDERGVVTLSNRSDLSSAVTNQYWLNFSTAFNQTDGNNAFAGICFTGTVTQTAATGLFSSHKFICVGDPTGTKLNWLLQANGAMPALAGYAYRLTVRADTGVTITGGQNSLFVDETTYTRNGTGTIADIIHRTLWSAPEVQAGTTVLTRYGVDINEMGGAGTTTLQAGLRIAALAVATTNLSVLSEGSATQMRHAGPAAIGINAAPNTTLDVDGDFATRAANLALANGNNDNIAIGARSFIRVTGPTAAFTIRGIASGFNGKRLVIYNTTTQNMTFNHEDAGSTAANRIRTMTGAAVATTGEGIAELIYDATLSRWLLLFVTA